ncbi:MAG: hypothetical protein JO031_02590 [Ktedonobacteraceae bacterium]|nr:hypothetical protein [Ktedonobacteraceae bacterium]
MTTQIALRHKAFSGALIIAGLVAFAALLTISGMTGHILGLFGITYAQAQALVLAIINHAIGTLPAWLQVIAKAVEQAVLNLYNQLGLQPVIAW